MQFPDQDSQKLQPKFLIPMPDHVDVPLTLDLTANLKNPIEPDWQVCAIFLAKVDSSSEFSVTSTNTEYTIYYSPSGDQHYLCCLVFDVDKVDAIADDMFMIAVSIVNVADQKKKREGLAVGKPPLFPGS